VAVVQISKIQVRRGKKNSNTGVPQLSSAEFAWAVDSQELFIGNGSVAEGAPAVGNTKILTANDNLIELANAYEFANDNTNITNTVERSLQSKIDEIQVSVLDFGAVPDGSTDSTEAFKNAMETLFQNPDDSYRKILYIPNGQFLINNDLKIPSNAIIRGETRSNSVIEIGASNIEFITTAGETKENFTSSNRPRSIDISNITVKRSTGSIDLSGVFDTQFRDVTFEGEYQLSDAVSDINNESAALVWENDIVGVKVTDIKFENCNFEKNSVSFSLKQTAVFDTFLYFESCKFYINYSAFFSTGIPSQGNYWTFDGCEFEEIFSNAMFVNQGIGTTIRDSRFRKCSNGQLGPDQPQEPFVIFGEFVDNKLERCTSDRQKLAGTTNTGSIVYVSEAQNSSATSFDDIIVSDIFLSDALNTLAIFSAENRVTNLNYTLRLGTELRTGELTLVVDEAKTKVSIFDSFDYSDNSQSSTAGQLMTKFEFGAELVDNDSNTVIDTLILKYRNPLASGETGNISYSVRYSV